MEKKYQRQRKTDTHRYREPEKGERGETLG